MKKPRLICGIMSGTSFDGIDAVLLSVSGSGARTSFEQLAYVEHPFPRGIMHLLHRNSHPATARLDEIARLNFLLAELYAEAVNAVAKRARVKHSSISLIGSHGQTICHLPSPQRILSRSVRATLQIGDPSVLATLTGITTVGDFRVADMAAGGQGAPLVPYFDWLTFRSKTKNRIALNIGGIANLTVLPKECRPDEVLAFDTGPGNMIVDGLMQRFYGRRFDRDGTTANEGAVNLRLLQWMMKHPFLRKRPPKSTGREEFGNTFVDRLLKAAVKVPKNDILTTASFFTPLTIYEGCRRFAPKGMPIDELILSGGGAHNKFFVRTLQTLFGENVVKRSEEFGIPADAKEAICFAILANETVMGNASNLPSVTGARRKVLLGKVCRAR
jgi:anhydro-N-acetylmuramic acid kinase